MVKPHCQKRKFIKKNSFSKLFSLIDQLNQKPKFYGPIGGRYYNSQDQKVIQRKHPMIEMVVTQKFVAGC